MKLSEGVEWGVHCAVLLATLPAGSTMSGRALASYFGVSESYLLKHLKALAHAGILVSVPGPKGGFRLARAPESISLLEAVDALEGSGPAFRCTEIRQRGPAARPIEAYTKPCGVHVSMARAEALWRKSLRSESLSDLAARIPTIRDPVIAARLQEWLRANVRHAVEKVAVHGSLGRERNNDGTN